MDESEAHFKSVMTTPSQVESRWRIICTVCGCVVYRDDVVLHREWHRKLAVALNLTL
jgi:hypothetical protein